LGFSSNLQAATELSTGGFAAAGFVLSGNQEDAVIIRTHPLGDTTWTRIFGDSSTGDRLFDIAELTNQTIVAAGYSNSGLKTLVAGYSQNGEQLWLREIDWDGPEQARSILPLDDGGFLLLGHRDTPTHNLDLVLIRFTATGDSLFSRTHGTAGTDIAEELLPGENGNFELIGSARDVSNNNYDFLQITVDSNGDFVREQLFGGNNWELVYCATRDSSSGDIIIAGESRPSGDRDAYAIRLNSAGSLQWARSYNDGRLSERFAGVAPYLEGGALFAGQTGGSVSSGQLWLVSIAANGDTNWTWTGAETGRIFEDLIRISDGGFIACGKASISNNDRGLMWRISPPSGISGVVRDRITNETVAGVRVQAIELPQYSESDSVGRFTLALPPGNYTIFSGGPCFAGDTVRGLEVIANENTLSDITVGVAHMTMQHSTINVVGHNREQGVADLVVSNAGSGDLIYSFESIPLDPVGDWLRVDPPSGRLVPGDTLVAQVIVEADTADDRTYDYFGRILLHTNSCPETLRSIEVLAVILDADTDPMLPSEFALYPAFPNPFNSSARLRFGLDRETTVSIKVYDITGREVAVLMDNSRLSAGEHSLTWQAQGLASGLYFVRLQDKSRSHTQRLLYIR